MTGWRFVLLGAVLAVALAPPCAMARVMQVVGSHPASEEVVEGSLHAQYSVRFDGPVDHRQSLVSITGPDGKVISQMHPLLDSAPNVLFASGPRLPAGAYQMHWIVRSIPDGEVSSGLVSFKVKDK